ncbi:ABC transporter permease [Anaerovorax odorimutans]|uniref:ABC transporter permease n=1 Tax=Anaerovorax odorimutans TaxID=109327 RepID=A0ABT1RQU8_9FIRM|nr:ABC transporter permease [Anaerovorax odorimutans]MCQ4637575.1 ABC transporter permease [Anaerovorax odorimutans]
MNKLIALELKRNGLRSYNLAVIIITAVMLLLLYLLAAIPKIDPAENELAMFMSYKSLLGLTNIICMVAFMILSSAMSAKFIVEEYSGKRAALLFSYPVARWRILRAKLTMVFLYTAASMLLCGMIALGVFFSTESVFHLCADQLTIGIVCNGLLSLLLYSLAAGVWGMVALWFGFCKQSVIVTIIAAVIFSVILCQLMSAAFILNPLMSAAIVLVSGLACVIFVLSSLKRKISCMEV